MASRADGGRLELRAMARSRTERWSVAPFRGLRILVGKTSGQAAGCRQSFVLPRLPLELAFVRRVDSCGHENPSLRFASLTRRHVPADRTHLPSPRAGLQVGLHGVVLRDRAPGLADVAAPLIEQQGEEVRVGELVVSVPG